MKKRENNVRSCYNEHVRYFVCLFVCVCLSFPVFAGNATHVSDPQYRYLVRQLMTYVPPSFDFGTFRKTYTLTSYYDPIGDGPVEALLRHAYQVENPAAGQSSTVALEAYNTTLRRHLANIMVVRQAYALARQDKKFGDEKNLLAIYNGLSAHILNAGDGRRLSNAYHVMTLAEELFILGQLGYRLKNTEYVDMGMTKYNMHYVQDPKPEDPITLFINVSRPMQEIERRAKDNKTLPKDLKFKG
jgi:hypothetical protein